MLKKIKIFVVALLALIVLFFLYIFISPEISDYMKIEYIKNKCCEKFDGGKKINNNFYDESLKWEDGVGFLKGGKVIFNPWELPTGELIISEDAIKMTNKKIIVGSKLWFSKCSVVVYNAEKNDPYFTGGDQNEYCLKTDGEKLYIKAPKEKEWSELKFKYLGEIPKDKHTYETEIAYYPCKKIKLECKYFSGIYEIHCER